MLHDFLTINRKELISRCEAKVAKRSPKAAAVGGHGVPLFLEQLVDTLYREQLTVERKVHEPEKTPAHTEIGRAAALHGAELLRKGYSVDQVVHDYGDVCQAVNELALEQKARISVEEFCTLNRCLDNAIADAVTAFAEGQQDTISDLSVTFAKEQERLIHLAIQTISTIQSGNLSARGTTTNALLNTLYDLRDLVDQSPPKIH